MSALLSDPAVFPGNFWQRPRRGWLGVRYVLTSSDASRRERVVSALAVLETLTAVAFYWAIAAIWDTHIHLVISLFVAPLLLLRSPESCALGVDNFLSDHLGLKNFDGFSRRRKVGWLTLVGLLGAAAGYALTAFLVGHWLMGHHGWHLFWNSAVIGVLGVWLGATGAGAGSKEVLDDRVGAVAVLGVIVGAAAGLAAGVGAVAGLGTVAGAVTAAVAVGTGAIATGVRVGEITAAGALATVGFGPGYALRALVFRTVSTFGCLPQGFARLPENWLESTLVVDMRSDAELLPGIKHRDPFFHFPVYYAKSATRITS